MKAEEVEVEQWVVYRPHPGAPAEDGTVVERREGGLVMVRYWAKDTVLATYARDLEPGAAFLKKGGGS